VFLAAQRDGKAQFREAQSMLFQPVRDLIAGHRTRDQKPLAQAATQLLEEAPVFRMLDTFRY
jgi:hypothetical protein